MGRAVKHCHWSPQAARQEATGPRRRRAPRAGSTGKRIHTGKASLLQHQWAKRRRSWERMKLVYVVLRSWRVAGVVVAKERNGGGGRGGASKKRVYTGTRFALVATQRSRAESTEHTAPVPSRWLLGLVFTTPTSVPESRIAFDP